MSTYHAPLPEMQFVLTELAGLAQVAQLPGFEDATSAQERFPSAPTSSRRTISP